jgi:NAD(P)-dependent dehydrogenase (short-subunit alcohol dehydrogenase family)
MICIVTGGGGAGIGGAICRALAGAGSAVYVVDHEHEAAERVARQVDEAGGRGIPVTLDVGDVDKLIDVFTGIAERESGIDVLVNSAAAGLVKPAADASLHEFDRVIDVNLRAVWAGCKAVLPFMVERGRGSIVNVGSNHSIATTRGFSVYAATKAGIAGLSRGIAADYGRYGIRCNVVHPGLVDSPLNRTVLADAFGDAEAWMDGWVTRRQMVPYPLAPDDIGAVVAFLASDASRAITGAELVADGGTSALLIDND